MLLMTAAAACGGGPSFERGRADALAAIDAALESGADLATFESLAARYPKSFEVRLEFARRATKAGKNGIAIETFEALSAADPSDLAVARRLAALCLFVGQLERASAPIERLLAASGTTGPSADDWVLAARLAHAKGELAAAEQTARAAVAANPKSSAAHRELALVLLELDPLDEPAVLAELKAALALDPGLAEAHYALGTLLLQSGDEAPGKRALEASTLVHELGSPAFTQLPPAKRIQRAYQIGARLPSWSRPPIEIARAELELGRPKKAESSLERAAALAPDNPERHKLLFATAKATGNETLAAKRLAAWRKAR